MKKYVVSIELVTIIGEGDYKKIRPSMIADGKTTVAEIEEFFSQYHPHVLTEIVMIELQDKNDYNP